MERALLSCHPEPHQTARDLATAIDSLPVGQDLTAVVRSLAVCAARDDMQQWPIFRTRPPLQDRAFAQPRQQLSVDSVEAAVAKDRDHILRLQQRHEPVHDVGHIRLVKGRPA